MKMKYFLFSAIILLAACQNTPTTHQEKEVELDISIITQKSPINTSIRGIFALDSNVIWLSGAKGVILRTVNGGGSWEKLNSPDQDSLDFRSIHAFSEKSAIITSAGFPARVYTTNNAGMNWSLVYENKDSSAFMNSIAFKNNKEGIIIGDQLNGRHLILKTGNSGVTWHRVDSNDVPKPLKIENAFAASGSCIAVSQSGRFFIGFGGEESRVFSSVNGSKWKAKTTPLYHGKATTGIYSISSSGNGKIMAVGGDYTKVDSSYYPIISLNDGKSWLKTKGMLSGYRSVIDYCKEGDFWLCGGTNGLELSADDGKTWNPFSSQDINTLRFLPSTTKAIAANSKGEIFSLDIKMTNRKN